MYCEYDGHDVGNDDDDEDDVDDEDGNDGGGDDDGAMVVMRMIMVMTMMVMQVTGKYKNTGKKQSMSGLAIDGFGKRLG